jgi:hypothetical protein
LSITHNINILDARICPKQRGAAGYRNFKFEPDKSPVAAAGYFNSAAGHVMKGQGQPAKAARL